MKKFRGAKIFVRRRKDGKYLILTGSVWPERPERSEKPDLPGGIVEPGETYEQGALRELAEETGIVATEAELKLVLQKTVPVKGGDKLAGLKLYLLEADDPRITISWEHQAYEWLSIDELKSLEIRQPYRWLLDHIIKSGLLN